MADKRNLCAMIPADLHAQIRQEQERTGKTLSEYVEQLITDYYKMKENTKMTGDILILFHMVVQIVRMFCLIEIPDIDSDLVMLLGIWPFSPKIAEQCPARGTQ